MNSETAVIGNITDQQWILHRTYGTFIIPACPAGQVYALAEIGPRKGIIDLGDRRTLEYPLAAREIAGDLAREVNSYGGEGSYFGVFVCAGERPTPTEMDEARRRL